ncbi:hypothetical protein [Thalassomonas actiniarum]|uniref:Uncharacterized protein n=1 Tax=Thalassomonas actiniarum TaxID=485447 RepID=A0AAF0C3V1_9GAMM|nr:hypothetical protein [Thalassomonas actiniarum]WDE01602.1 hypothetical protein SG35_013855 [Thalassomonas actiniarum]
MSNEDIRSSVGAEQGDPSTLSNMEAIQDWQLAWSRLVSYAWENWNDAEVMKSLLADPHHYLKQFGYQGQFDTTKIKVVLEGNGAPVNLELNEWDSEQRAGYQSPDVKPAGEESVEPLTNGWNSAHENNQLAGALVVVLPKPPEKDQTLALADYMAISNYQPFTCT